MKGFWDNYPVDVVGVTYTVTKCTQPPMSWQNPVAGTKRQGLKIKQNGFDFIIDNEHGDGYLKVTEGRGSFRYGHKSVMDPLSVIEIPDEQINKVYNTEALQAQAYEHDKWMAQNFPVEFKRVMALRAEMKAHRDRAEREEKKGD